MNQYVLFALLAFPSLLTAQSDTVIVELAKTSKLMFTMQDSTDLELLREYDYDALFEDILHQLEMINPSPQVSAGADITITPDEDLEDHDEDDEDHEGWMDAEHDGEWDDGEDDPDGEEDHYPCSRNHYFLLDFGINNWLQPGRNPDDVDPIYTVRPWGSWYVGANAMRELRLGDQFSFELRGGLSFYNFKFDEDDILLTKTPTETVFSHDPRSLNFRKSKLAIVHVNVGFVAMLNSRDYDHHRGRFNWDRDGFRIGLGPYVGYRLDSYHKQQYEEADDDNEIERDRSNFHLNNLRYGVRLQLGIENVDWYFQYDLNELFKDDRGPRLNAFSFGISF